MNRRALAGRGDFWWLLLMAEGRRSPLEGLLPWTSPGGEATRAELRFAEQIGVRVRQPVAAPEGAAPDLKGRLTRALSSRQATVNDLSASRAVIEISGPRARALLEK